VSAVTSNTQRKMEDSFRKYENINKQNINYKKRAYLLTFWRT